jgi:hypothetical protein
MNTAAMSAPINRFLRETSPMVRIIVILNVIIFAVPYLLDQLGVVYKTVAVSELLLIYGAKDNIAMLNCCRFFSEQNLFVR